MNENELRKFLDENPRLAEEMLSRPTGKMVRTQRACPWCACLITCGDTRCRGCLGTVPLEWLL